MDSELEAQLNEQLQQMSDLLSQQNSAMSAQIKAMNDAVNASNGQSSAAKNLSSAENDAVKNTSTSNKKVESAGKAMDMVKEANERLSTSLDKGKSAISGFAVAMTDVTPGMAKYAASLKDATLAVATMASGFGPLGKATEGILGVFASLVTAATKYNDAVVQGYDDVSKLGAGIGTSAEDIVKLGHNAGLSSQNLSLLTKNAASLGMNIRSLGTTTSKGLDTFGKMIAVGDTTLEQYRKLGFSQEDLIEAQTAYIDIQTQAGADLKKSPEELQKASLAYIDNLNVMAEMTGVSVKQQQDAQKQALAQENFDVYMSGLQAKKAEALKSGNKAEADRLQKIYDAKLELATQAKANLDPKQAQGVLEGISTNGKTIMSKEVAKLEMSGIHISKMNDELNKGNKQTGRLLGENAQAVENYRKRFGDLGTAAGDASIGMMNAFNLGVKSFESGNKFYDLRTKEGQEAWQKQYDATVEKQKKDKESHDKLLDQRAALEKNERQARLAFDDLLSKLSAMFTKVALKAMPLMVSALTFISNHFDTIVTVTKTLGIALAALAAVMAGAKVVNFFRSFTDNMKGIFLGKQTLGSSTTKPMHVRMAGSGKAVTTGSGAVSKMIGKSASAGNLLNEAEEVAGKKGNKNGMLGKAEQGMSGISKMSSAPGADKSGIFLEGLAKGLQALGKAAPEVIEGSGALAAAIVAIGAAVGAAGFILGKTLPYLATGLHDFDKVNGENLKDVGIGMAGLGAGILAMGGSTVVNAFGSIVSMFSQGKDEKNDPIKKLGEQIVNFQNIPIKPDKVEKNAKAFVAFSQAFAQAAATSSLGTVASGIANGVSGFFSKEPPFKKFKEFSELKINEVQTKKNALAFKEFAEAMSSYHGNGPLGALGSISTALADAVYKHFQMKPPVDEFAHFASLPIDPKKAKSNAEAFVDFANAMSNYKAAPGALDALSQLVGGGLMKLVGVGGPVDAFADFAKRDFGPNMEKNADAFQKYAESMAASGGIAGSSPGGGGGGGAGGSSGAGGSALQSGVSAGQAAVGFVGGLVSGAGNLVSNAFDWAKAGITGKPTDVLNFTGESGQYANFAALDPAMQQAVILSATDYKKATGRKMTINSARRSVADQERLWAETVKLGHPGIGPHGMLVAKPPRLGGNPPHLRGNAIDIQEGVSDSAKAIPILKAHNLKQTYGGKDPVHFDLKAKDGGVFDGPRGGYPIAMHGSEMISPLKKDSILMKLAKTSASKVNATDAKKKISQVSQTHGSSQVLYSENMRLNKEIAEKLDRVITVLESDHDTQHKILREVRI